MTNAVTDSGSLRFRIHNKLAIWFDLHVGLSVKFETFQSGLYTGILQHCFLKMNTGDKFFHWRIKYMVDLNSTNKMMHDLTICIWFLVSMSTSSFSSVAKDEIVIK